MDFREHHNYRRMFWKRSSENSTSCGPDEATHVEIEVRRGPFRTSLVFEWPGQRVRADDLTAMLDTAFDYGKAHAKAEVRAVLGL